MKNPRSYGLVVVALICAIAATITAFRGPSHFWDHGFFAAAAAVMLTAKLLLDYRRQR